MNRTDAEKVLIRRCGTALTAVGLDGATATGANPDLNDPIWFALDRLGYGVVSISAVADPDIEAVSTEDYAPFLDLAELRTLETTLNAATSLVDITVGPRRESLGQLSERLEKLIAAKRAVIYREYGDLFGAGQEGGTFSVGFQEDGKNVY